MPDASVPTEPPLPSPAARAVRRQVAARAGLRHGVVVVEGTLDWIEGDRVHLTGPFDPAVDELVELRMRLPTTGERVKLRLLVEACEPRRDLDLPVTARIVEFSPAHRAAFWAWLVPPSDPEIEVDADFRRVRARWRSRAALRRDWARSLGCAGLSVPWTGEAPSPAQLVAVELHLPGGEIVEGPAQIVMELEGAVGLALRLDRDRMAALRAGATLLADEPAPA